MERFPFSDVPPVLAMCTWPNTLDAVSEVGADELDRDLGASELAGISVPTSSTGTGEDFMSSPMTDKRSTFTTAHAMRTESFVGIVTLGRGGTETPPTAPRTRPTT